MSTNQNSNSNYASNILDALVYSSIKNNLNPTNYPSYDLMRSKTSSASSEDLNNIISNSTIKKACCSAESKFQDDNYETHIPILDPEGKMPYIDKKITVPVSICKNMNILPKSDLCNNFKVLYCENSKYLFNQDKKKIDIFSQYSPFCSNYTPIKPPLTKEQILKQEQDARQLRELELAAIQQYTQPDSNKSTQPDSNKSTSDSNKSTQPDSNKSTSDSNKSTQPDSNKSTQPDSNKSTSDTSDSSQESSSSKIIIPIIICLICCCCCISILIGIYFATKSKSVKSTQ